MKARLPELQREARLTAEILLEVEQDKAAGTYTATSPTLPGLVAEAMLWFHVSEPSFYCNQPGNWNMSTATPRSRRSFTAEQKVHAIRLVREQHLSVNAVCQDLN